MPTPTRNTLTQLRYILLTRRTRLGMSQRELAQLMGGQQSTISDLENGHRTPSIHTLHRWATALGLTLDITLNDPEDAIQAATEWAAQHAHPGQTCEEYEAAQETWTPRIGCWPPTDPEGKAADIGG